MFEFPEEIADLTDVPTAYQGLYERGEEGFKLDDALHSKLAQNDPHMVAELKTFNANLTEQLNAYQAIADNPEGLAEQLKGFESQVSDHLSALTQKDEEITALTSKNDAYLIDNVASAAIRDARGDVPLLLPHLRAAIDVVVEEGTRSLRVRRADGDPPLTDAEQPFNVVDLVQEMKSSPVFARAFDGTSISGGGMSPSGAGARGTAVNRDDYSAVNSRLEEIAAGRITVSM